MRLYVGLFTCIVLSVDDPWKIGVFCDFGDFSAGLLAPAIMSVAILKQPTNSPLDRVCLFQKGDRLDPLYLLHGTTIFAQSLPQAKFRACKYFFV